MTMENVAKMEPRRGPRVDRASSGGGGWRERVSALESRMTVVEACAQEAADNTRQVLALITATKGVSAFLKKHGPRLFAFGIGAAVSGGYLGEGMASLLRNLFGV